MREKGIVIIPSWYPNREDPVAGIFIKEQAKALLAAGVNISVFSVSDRLIPCSPVLQYEIEDNLPTFRIKSFVPPKRIKTLRFYWYQQWGKLLQEFITMHGVIPQLFHAHSFVGGAAARYLSKKYNIPYVITEHYDGFISGNIPGHWQGDLPDLYTDASRVLAVSPNLAKAMHTYHDAVEVVPNMINISFFYPRASPACNQIPHIISVGTLEARKDHRLLIRAFSKLRKSQSAKLTLIGDGPLLGALKQLARSMGVADWVDFKGNLVPQEVAKVLRTADLYVSTSRSESFALAPVEAIACGLPVVMMRCGSILEEPGFETVRVIDQEDDMETAIKQQLLSLSPEKLFLASQYVRSRFSPESVIHELKRIYAETAFEKKSR